MIAPLLHWGFVWLVPTGYRPIRTFNSWDGVLRQCIPLDGKVSEAVVAPNAVVPLLWRSALVPGVDDPRPINGEVGIPLQHRVTEL